LFVLTTEIRRGKNTFARITTHSGFLQIVKDKHAKAVADDAQKKGRKEVIIGWEMYKRGQEAEVSKWKVEKERCMAEKRKAPLKPKPLLKKDWIVLNHLEAAGDDEGGRGEHETSSEEEEDWVFAKSGHVVH
jgi:hypothetical protein